MEIRTPKNVERKRKRKVAISMYMRRRSRILIIFFFSLIIATYESNADDIIDLGRKNNKETETKIIEVKNEPKDVVWVAQLSDLHFSAHHPERAIDFKSIVGPTLSFIKPSLVFITGDLTDGKSKDLLTMKQDEREWIEYRNVMEDVVRRSRLNKSIFYDLRGNHDNFGVSSLGGSSDFFSTYSLNGQLNRREQVNDIMIQTSERDLLFVGIDSTTSSGLRGPTNLFGHPNDQLLDQISLALSNQEFRSVNPITKIAFGHFPLSFSAPSSSGKTLKNIFLNGSLTAYLCGHLHTKFGSNLKRHHVSSLHYYPHESVQLDAIRLPLQEINNCSEGLRRSQDFWEFEMGDWKKSRSFRILAVDRGHLSFVDVDFQLGAKKTIILPTFPLDSRYSDTAYRKEKCRSSDASIEKSIRALVFSASPIVSVIARIYDSSFGNLDIVMESTMEKAETLSSRGDLYSVLWNYQAFDDPSALRYWFQVEAIDVMGRSTLSERRPFSLRGFQAKFSWTLKEFFVMGCQWSDLYYPVLSLFYFITLTTIIVPKIILTISKNHYNYKHFRASKGVLNCAAWIFTELYKLQTVWCCIVSYLFYLILCPWLHGHVFSDDNEKGYMSYRGWVLKRDKMGDRDFLGFPDVMVVVLSHLFIVVLPTMLVIGGFCVERSVYHHNLLLLSGKKEDDHVTERSGSYGRSGNTRLKPVSRIRWMRKIIIVACLIICWRHIKNCRALVKAYEMNPILDFPIYSFAIPLLLVYTVYKTGKN